jgi:hypothetical protein
MVFFLKRSKKEQKGAKRSKKEQKGDGGANGFSYLFLHVSLVSNLFHGLFPEKEQKGARRRLEETWRKMEEQMEEKNVPWEIRKSP